jgi:hypothetical protein
MSAKRNSMDQSLSSSTKDGVGFLLSVQSSGGLSLSFRDIMMYGVEVKVRGASYLNSVSTRLSNVRRPAKGVKFREVELQRVWLDFRLGRNPVDLS